MQGNRLEGDGTWPWLDAEVDGDDIVVRNTPATWFGGNFDTQDSGHTASGVDTKGNPHILGCALPLNIPDTPCAGSPIPHIPWHTHVHVYCHETHKQITVQLIDLGPSKKTHHGLDLTVAAFEALGVSLSKGVMHCDYRIVGGAKKVHP